MIYTVNIFLIISSSLPSVVTFLTYTPETFPDSMTQPIACGIPEPGFLCDPNGVLKHRNTTDNYQVLSRALFNLREITACSCSAMDSNLGSCDNFSRGFTISIALIEQMVLDEDQRDEESVLFAAMKFANTVRRRQYRGQCEDDLLIFLSTKDKVVWTSVGEVTQRYLSTQMINSITISSETHFRNGEYTEGLQYMVDSYTSILNGEHLEVISNAGWIWPIPKWIVITTLIFIVIFLLTAIFAYIFCCVRFCRRGNRAEYQLGTRM